jgi:hypothetical protein
MPDVTGLPPLPFQSAAVHVTGTLWLSWSLLDRRTGEIAGSSTMDETNWSASLIKPWLAADYLRQNTPSSGMRHTIEILIRDSDNEAANVLYSLDGGPASIRRLVRVCGLTDTVADPYDWGVTNISARDTVRMGACLADGRAAGPQWTSWLLELMRSVRGEGNFGIRDALPPAESSAVAIKNGWEHFTDDDLFHVNCMAIGDTWVLAVMQRYQPADGWSSDLARGAERCTEVAEQLLSGKP